MNSAANNSNLKLNIDFQAPHYLLLKFVKKRNNQFIDHIKKVQIISMPEKTQDVLSI